MLIFYYQHEGTTHLVCVRGGYPTRLSPIWRGCNTSVMLVPGSDYEGEGCADSQQ
jgi:hypothetical protein